jgi:hypothetical protein
LGLSSINFPLIASEKEHNSPSHLPFSSTLYIHSIYNSSKCSTPLLSWNSFRTLFTTSCSLTNKFTLVIAFLPRPGSQPVVTAVCHGVESVSQGLSLSTTYLPPSLSAQHLFNTDIYSTSLHTQADTQLFNVVRGQAMHTMVF